jgi:hypothetical protein
VLIQAPPEELRALREWLNREQLVSSMNIATVEDPAGQLGPSGLLVPPLSAGSLHDLAHALSEWLRGHPQTNVTVTMDNVRYTLPGGSSVTVEEVERAIRSDP